jgi:hypothetical protein
MVSQDFDADQHTLDTSPAPPAPAQPVYREPQRAAVPAPERPTEEEGEAEGPEYRYVVREVPNVYHVYEETTGARISHMPYTSEHEAQEYARIANARQFKPV